MKAILSYVVYVVCVAWIVALENAYAQDGILQTAAGTGLAGDSGDGGQATSAAFKSVVAVQGLPDGSYLVLDNGANRIKKVDANNVISNFAGTGEAGFGGDESWALEATFNNPSDIVIDSLNNVYVADTGNNVIRKIDFLGIITTFFTIGYDPFLNNPRGLAVDAKNNLYVADYSSGRIIKLDTRYNPVGVDFQIVAGDPDVRETDFGDGGPATSAGLWGPGDVAIASDNTMYILEQDSHRIRKVDTSGMISVYAGTGTVGYSGDGGLATSAQFNFDNVQSSKLEIDPAGNILIADSGNHVIRRIRTATNIIETISGKGISGFSGDNKWAIDGEHTFPYGVGCFVNGDILVADSGNFRIRKVSTSFSTPQGTNSTVSIGTEATLNFKNVTSIGSVTIDVRDKNDPLAPGDFQLSGGRYFDINTDARFSGNIVITLAYIDTNPADEVEDLQNKILHYTGSIWEDVTIEVRPAMDQVDGRVSSLSPFVLVKPKETILSIPFRRADANADGERDISDAVFILLDLFVDGFSGACADAEDVNDDGQIDISDPIVLLYYLFRKGADLPAPGPELSGYDLSEDSLGCVSYNPP